MSGVSRKDIDRYQEYIVRCTDEQLNAAWWLEHCAHNRRFERECMMEAVRRGYTLTKPDVYESRRNKAVPSKSPPAKPKAIPAVVEQLQSVLADIPNEVKLQGLSLPDLQNRFTGRWRGKCHPGELGEALRKLNWGRHRRWDKYGTENFAALWYPPEAHDVRKQIKDVLETKTFITNLQKELNHG